jgi:hypothetical protein
LKLDIRPTSKEESFLFASIKSSDFIRAYLLPGKKLAFDKAQRNAPNITYYSERHDWKTPMNANELGSASPPDLRIL